jgi:hypothetical protein
VKRRFDHRPSSTARGYDRAWSKARAMHLANHPWCVMCLAKGEYVQAKHVDHMTSIRQAPRRRLDRSNFQSLCDPHHNLITASIDSGDLSGACDVEGLPLDPTHPWSQSSDNAAMTKAANTPRVKRAPPPGVTAQLKRQALGGRR